MMSAFPSLPSWQVCSRVDKTVRSYAGCAFPQLFVRTVGENGGEKFRVKNIVFTTRK